MNATTQLASRVQRMRAEQVAAKEYRRYLREVATPAYDKWDGQTEPTAGLLDIMRTLEKLRVTLNERRAECGMRAEECFLEL
jgi:hypothetical protein